MVTSLLSATESAVLCSPTSTWIEAGALTSPVKLSKVQWAAVRMWRLVMMEPPQKGVRVLFCDHTKPTWSGREIISADCLGLPYYIIFVPRLPRILVHSSFDTTNNPGPSVSLSTMAGVRIAARDGGCCRWCCRRYSLGRSGGGV